MAWYNETDPFCCSVLRARIADGRLPPGEVVERDVRTIQPDEIPSTGQVHLFAGIGGFGYAARLAGLPDGFDLWTAGFPCQDISTAGRGAGLSGTRSGLFFEILRLLRGVQRRPAWLLLENVPALRTRGYDRVAAELEGVGYAVAPLVVGAWAVGAPHKRNRTWIVGRLEDCQGRRTRSVSARPGNAGPGTRDANGSSQGLADPERDGGRQQEPGRGAEGRTAAGGAGEGVDNAASPRFKGNARCETSGPARNEARWEESAGRCSGELAESGRQRRQGAGRGNAGSLAAAPACAWPSRPGQPQHGWEAPRLLELPLGGLVDGIPVRLVRRANQQALKAYGNSIVPQVAAAVMQVLKEISREH